MRGDIVVCGSINGADGRGGGVMCVVPSRGTNAGVDMRCESQPRGASVASSRGLKAPLIRVTPATEPVHAECQDAHHNGNQHT